MNTKNCEKTVTLKKKKNTNVVRVKEICCLRKFQPGKKRF